MNETETFLILKYGSMLAATSAWLKNRKADTEFTPEEQVVIAKYLDNKFPNLQVAGVRNTLEKYEPKDD